MTKEEATLFFSFACIMHHLRSLEEGVYPSVPRTEQKNALLAILQKLLECLSRFFHFLVGPPIVPSIINWTKYGPIKRP